MFFHNFKYTLKVLCRNRALLFWTFIFPIVLGTFFNMAFSNIENSEKLDLIDIAIVENEEFMQNQFFQETFKTLGNKDDESSLFNVSYTTLDRAKELLISDEITGYLMLENGKWDIMVNENGVNETIIQFVVDEVQSQNEMIQNLVNEKIETENINASPDYAKLYQDASVFIQAHNTTILNNVSRKNLSYTMIEFYTLIAMSCLYGGMLSMHVINSKLANMSSVGKRTSISPIHKGKMLIGSLLASYLVQLVGLCLLFLYTIFVLKVDYGEHLLLIILLACVGSFAGLSLGIAVGTLVTSSENAKTGVLLSITMLGCFLSGMMGITMKYIIDKNIPILNQINPAGMITDGFYSLYYYDTWERFIFDVISLLIFSFLIIVISYRGLRRQTYDSI